MKSHMQEIALICKTFWAYHVLARQDLCNQPASLYAFIMFSQQSSFKRGRETWWNRFAWHAGKICKTTLMWYHMLLVDFSMQVRILCTAMSSSSNIQTARPCSPVFTAQKNDCCHTLKLQKSRFACFPTIVWSFVTLRDLLSIALFKWHTRYLLQWWLCSHYLTQMSAMEVTCAPPVELNCKLQSGFCWQRWSPFRWLVYKTFDLM